MEEEVTVLGQTNFRGQSRQFGIYPDDRRRHVYVIGKTGVGKTTFLENMIAQDIVNGKGVCWLIRTEMQQRHCYERCHRSV